MKIPQELEIDPEKAIRYGVAWVKDYFKSASIKMAVVGISGGSDSAMTAYITAKAIGKENVIGVSLPEDGMTTKEDVLHVEGVIKSLGIKRAETNITGIIDSIIKSDEDLLKIKNRVAYANIKARIRMVLLYKEANKNKALVAGTGDRSEHLLGYYTKYGDGGVDMNVPGYLYKTQVRQLLDYISEKENMPIMKEIALKKPSPRLWAEQTAEEELDIDYQTIDWVFYHIKDSGKGWEVGELSKKLGVKNDVIEKIMRMEKANMHKNLLPPSPPVIYDFNLHRN